MRLGEKYKVYVETKEGQVMELDTISVQMDVSLDYHGIMPTSEITLKVAGLPKWESSKGFRIDKYFYYKR